MPICPRSGKISDEGGNRGTPDEGKSCLLAIILSFLSPPNTFSFPIMGKYLFSLLLGEFARLGRHAVLCELNKAS